MAKGCQSLDGPLVLCRDDKKGSKVSAKRENFIRLAESRVSRAIDSIRVIGNLSNRSNYEYDDQDVQQIVKTLQNEVNKLKMQFETKSGKSKQQFKLGK